MIKVIHFWILIAIVLILSMTIACPVLAEESNLAVFNGRDHLLSKTIQSPITLSNLGLETALNPPLIANQSTLLKEYDRLLRIARALGTDFNISIPLHTLSENRYSIIGIGNSKGAWDNLTVGRTINLVSSAINQLTASSSSEMYFDLLIKNVNSNTYYPLNDISLSQYCTLLLSS